jgi:beta-fructofuranosidase
VKSRITWRNRSRPALHFTPRAGWINDPHGVVFAGGRYHLFYQYNAAGTVWDPAIAWGHATSPDLVSWTEQPVALAPEGTEVGCWSGAVVPDPPTLFYTRIVSGDPAHGQIARAVGTPDLSSWRRDKAGSVIATPPEGVVEFRDPMVFPAGDGWRMVVGGQLADGPGALLQYRSADLITWSYDGVLTADAGPSMWECPQLFPLDGTWVLIVSVMRDGVAEAVEYALGDYDGTRFTARTRGRFGHGDQMYATTAFTDADGRRCVMSWLRERGNAAPTGSPWAGAISVPWVLRVDGDRLVAAPHPNLPTAAGPALALELDGTGVVAVGDVTVRLDRSVTISAGAAPLLTMERGAGPVWLLADADLIEVVVDGVAGIGTARCPVDPAADVLIEGPATARINRFAAVPNGQSRRHAST